MRWIPHTIVSLGLVIGSGMTFSWLLAPLLPHLEMVNHFRPYTLIGAAVLVLAALMSGSHRSAAFVISFSCWTTC